MLPHDDVTEYCAGGALGRALRLDQGTPRLCAPPACTSGFRACYVNCYPMMVVTEYCAGGDLGRALRLDQGTPRRCAPAPRTSGFWVCRGRTLPHWHCFWER